MRLTVRGRRILAVLAALPAVIALSLAVISGGSALASRDTGAASGSFATLTVAAGDSLWSIAEQVAPGADPRDVVDAIVRLNALDGVTVSAGQQLSIPAEYTPSP
jgi:LysM repeat protein